MFENRIKVLKDARILSFRTCVTDSLCFTWLVTKQDSTSSTTGPPLAAIGVTTPAESLLVLPKEYVDLRRPHTKITKMPFDAKLRFFEAVLTLKVALDKNNLPTRSPYPRSLILSLSFYDATVEVKIIGNTAEWIDIDVNSTISFVSRLVQGYRGELRFKSIELMSSTGRAKAVYAGIPGKIAGALIERTIFGHVHEPMVVLAAAKLIRENTFASRELSNAGFASAEELLNDLHRPLTPENGVRALAAARTVCVEQVRSFAKISTVTSEKPYTDISTCLKIRASAQPEIISKGQGEALNIIRRAIGRQNSARILLNGDVGSGKTLVFLLVAASYADNGNRVAIMVPSDLVARQVFSQCQLRFPELMPALIVAGVESPADESKILIGTQALLHREIGSFDLVIIDEQHKFSVEQRNYLVGPDTHVIEASATPIPRSLALALFDGWIEAKILGAPVDKTINSELLVKTVRQPVVQAVKSAIERGEKVVFLYASVHGGDSSCVKAAERLAEHFPGLVGVVHGKLKADKKDAAMQLFRDGKTQILVSSTVIEVGVDVPGITVLVVNQADRFGVAQLHQIRGRLVRNGGTGHFFMLTDKEVGKDTLARLEAVKEHCDGFALAERDLEIRGFGEILGESQSGSTETFFKLPRLEPSDFVRR
jgi:ATP-dependent DNA helicase RecG